jgi:hypothetical protein
MQNLLWRAGYADNLPVAKWLREHGAEWPDTFCHTEHSIFEISDFDDGCWSLECVQWAIASGSTWREWRCCHYDHMMYECSCDAVDHDDGLLATSGVMYGGLHVYLHGRTRMAALVHAQQL